MIKQLMSSIKWHRAIIYVTVVISFQLTNFINVTAQSDTLLVKKRELSFTSPFEKEVFKNLAQDSSLHFMAKLLLSPSNPEDSLLLTQIESSINQIVEVYNSPSMLKKKPGKRLDLLTKEIHNKFFKVYKDDADFADIFKTGHFNCVGGTGLYALVLKKLEIPFAIKTPPGHAYLVAYPRSENIMIESTDAINTTISYSSAYREDFVKRLLEMKIIDSKDYRSMSVDQLFEQHFYKSKPTSLSNLAGVLYINKAVAFLEDKKYAQAYPLMEKAYFLYPSNHHEDLLVLLWGLQYDIMEKNKPEVYGLIAKLSRCKKYGINAEKIDGIFNDFIQSTLHDSGDTTLLINGFHHIDSTLADTSIQRMIRIAFYTELGRYYYFQSNFDKALDNVYKALILKPKSQMITGMAKDAFFRLISVSESIPKIEPIMDLYLMKYPNLKEIPDIKRVLLILYIEQSGAEFSMDNPDKGHEYLQKFESQYSPELKNEKTTNMIASTYEECCLYYFRHQKKKQALQYINKGLEYAPNNFDLQKKKKYLESL